MTASDRPNWYARAFELWAREHFDTDTARSLAIDELRGNQRNKTVEPTRAPSGRMCGAERGDNDVQPV